MIDFEKIHPLAAKQAGLITRKQLMARGVTRRQIGHALATSILQLEVRNVYRLAGVPHGDDLPMWRAVLWAGPGCFISHTTAGWVWRLDGVGRWKPKVIDVSIAATRSLTAPEGIRTHRSSYTPGKHTTIEKGIPVTTLERTLVDLAEVLSPIDLDKAVDSATRKHPRIKVTTSQLMDSVSARGRHGYFALRKLVDDPASLGAGGSGLEVDVRAVLEQEGIRQPIPQLQICDDVTGEQIGIFDFAWPESRVVVLCHSRDWHTAWNQQVKDYEQENALQDTGWRVLKVTASILKNQRATWVGQLKQALGQIP